MIEKSLSVLLIDDENQAIDNLKNLIETYCPALNVIGSANSALEGIVAVNLYKPDAIFLDVNMPKHTGFELLKQIKHLPQVVFVTAHEKFALQALKICAIDFLLKPISIEELKETQNKLLQFNSIKKQIKNNYSVSLDNFSSLMAEHGSLKKITLYGKKGYEIIELVEILYLSGENNYTTFHFINRKEIIISKTLKEYEDMLGTFGFLRVHKSTIVNQLHIKKIKRTDNVNVILTNGTELMVSRRKVPELIEWSRAQLNIIK